MYSDLSFDEMISDPLIAQLRKADGVSTPDFTRILLSAHESYRAAKVRKMHKSHADQFYRAIGAGELMVPREKNRDADETADLVARCAQWKATMAECCRGA
ncbi:hypothetical protein SAMN03159496_05377 [Rhizobium sp. NFR07]|uniref:hypothetical protein n=1 Tax=Rhizobium sp. NFR07 TaxID=1566262 RepID=UPI0008E36B8E|nr:hypothetical protein [Rhizobium sp. NFR07]SFB58245.1 hypothetical protein SAMN03159496_05377 [Rhizobium sp. NFR07]